MGRRCVGLSDFALRRYPDAMQAWERVRRDVPEFEPIDFSLADAYGLQHEEGTALKVLREAERRWPADAEVANATGVIEIVAAPSTPRSSRSSARPRPRRTRRSATSTSPAPTRCACQVAALRPGYAKWIGGDEDRRLAVAAFQKYLQLGGPYERQAREALAALGWS